MYDATKSRDESFNGLFYIAVKTTGIFCRPGCPARTPLPQNVEYYASTDEALRAGYRPCLRCKPLDAATGAPEWMSELLNRIEAKPTLRITDKDLRASGLEPATVRRAFLARFGMTFQAYCRKVRMSMALPRLRNGAGVFETALEHGYESDSGFRAAFTSLFGESAKHARDAMTLAAKLIESPMGVMIAIADDDALCLLEFHDRRAPCHRNSNGCRRRSAHPFCLATTKFLSKPKGNLRSSSPENGVSSRYHCIFAAQRSRRLAGVSCWQFHMGRLEAIKILRSWWRAPVPSGQSAPRMAATAWPS